jgi:phage shock protein PspC (stress-responsive transcriptional regulator)
MHLTQKQESLISQYLRDLSRRLDARLPEKVRERNLRQVQTRIYHDLERLNSNAISDDEVSQVLRRITSNLTEETDPVAPSPLTETRTASGSNPPLKNSATTSLRGHAQSPKPIWLGVCAYNAGRFDIEPWMVRLGLVILGLCTGPLAVFVYIAAFAEYYGNLPEKERPAIVWPRLAVRTVVPVAVLIGLRWGANKLLVLIAYGHELVFKEAMPSLGEWDWFRFQEGTYFFFALLSVLPLSILSGLPLANAWGHSLKRLAQAITAFYAMALCFGVASVIAGLILDRVQAYLQ